MCRRQQYLGRGPVARQSDLTCVICGAQLVGDPDDQPDWPTGPMCGNCYQAREMDNELWWSEDAASETEGA